MSAGRGTRVKSASFSPCLSCGFSWQKGYVTRMTGIHVTSKEAGIIGKALVGEGGKEFSRWVWVWGVTEKGSIVQLKLGSRGRERQRSFSLEVQEVHSCRGWTWQGCGLGETNQCEVRGASQRLRNHYHFIDGETATDCRGRLPPKGIPRLLC